MFCQNCGKQIENDVKFCPYCGTENILEPKQEKPAVSVKKEKAGKKRTSFILIAVVALIIIVGMTLFPSANSGTSETIKDLSSYADYTEEQLVKELGYTKNASGIYPEETHLNFYFTDGKMYMISINKPADMGLSLCGVNLENSLEEADSILESKGFIRQGSLEEADNQTIFYTESATGFPYYIYTDAGYHITSLLYGLEAEESIYGDELLFEEPLPEENPAFAEEQPAENQLSETTSLTYGTYSCTDHPDIVSTADVTFYTDDAGGDYIVIDCWSSNRELACFEGMLENFEGNYYSYNEDLDTGIMITFTDGGMYVQISYSTRSDVYDIEGFYILEKALDVNAVS